jgi:hypothetical protein
MRHLLLVLALSACGGGSTGLALGPQIPPIPENLARKATALEGNSDVTMGGQVRDNNGNIRAYNGVAYQTNSLIDLYNCVRESINNKKEIKCQ